MSTLSAGAKRHDARSSLQPATMMVRLPARLHFYELALGGIARHSETAMQVTNSLSLKCSESALTVYARVLPFLPSLFRMFMWINVHSLSHALCILFLILLVLFLIIGISSSCSRRVRQNNPTAEASTEPSLSTKTPGGCATECSLNKENGNGIQCL